MIEPGSTVTFWQLVDDAARAHPHRVILADDHGRSLSCSQLREAALDTAAALAADGVGVGSRVSWQLPTRLEAMVLMSALARLGATQNPILPIWRDSEVRFATAQFETDVFVTSGVWRGYDHAAAARCLADERPMSIMVVDQDTPAGPELTLPVGDRSALAPPPSDATTARWVYYSSGTTAAPKGVRHSDQSVIAGSAGVVAIVGATSGDVNPIAFPVTHIGGAAMLAAALVTGMRLVLFDTFDPDATPTALAKHRPTLLGSATPFFVAFLAAQRRHGRQPLYPALRGCVGGGAPVTAELSREVREVFSVDGVANSWGLTEFPVATAQPPCGHPDLIDRTVGRTVPGVSLRVVDDNGREVRPGEEGELRLRGPQCFLGYVDSSLDVGAFDSDGWFRTGDQGRVDTAGNVFVTGRIKDAIIRNAENISALEIENVLASHPGVADVAVIGVPDARTGERVCAVVVSRSGTEVSLESLGEHCRAQGLSRHKAPERLELVDALPRNSTGKVLKAALRTTFQSS
ncbi:class I adenylate-forming enzyme family protein [Mycobacterium sp. SMC-4]|uniref:class I adenylate-forming enzyme family protein n=1 Tax=Mycobacterium sp. SMC-4 TaxID=2857059 RepID=UPI0021B20ED9|nr:AMP-binding protein [Mycobacterium sp. SMC-4]UXA20085.1 AMP-binding protein [Mycobacterium sp. SMC-4]